jgi:hypothetical protein
VPKPGNPQELNRYGYVNNNPLRHIDPTGHDCGCGDDEIGGAGDCSCDDGGYANTGVGNTTTADDATGASAGNQQAAGDDLNGTPPELGDGTGVGLRGQDAWNGLDFSKQGTGTQIGDFNPAGKTAQDIINNVPADWTSKPMEKGTGIEFTNPQPGQGTVNPDVDYLRLKVPDAKYNPGDWELKIQMRWEMHNETSPLRNRDYSRLSLDVNLNEVPFNSGLAHINLPMPY